MPRNSTYSIPVGHLEELTITRRSTSFSVLTALVWIQENASICYSSSAQAHETPSPSVWYYLWEGVGEGTTCYLIQSLQRQDYIHLRAVMRIFSRSILLPSSHHFLSGRSLVWLWWRRAGSRLLACWGFDARYGNPTFIKEGEMAFGTFYKGETVPKKSLVKSWRGKLAQLWKLTPLHFNQGFMTHSLPTGLTSRKSERGLYNGDGAIWRKRNIKRKLEGQKVPQIFLSHN